jgi:hypothetical protein
LGPVHCCGRFGAGAMMLDFFVHRCFAECNL